MAQLPRSNQTVITQSGPQGSGIRLPSGGSEALGRGLQQLGSGLAVAARAEGRQGELGDALLRAERKRRIAEAKNATILRMGRLSAQAQRAGRPQDSLQVWQEGAQEWRQVLEEEYSDDPAVWDAVTAHYGSQYARLTVDVEEAAANTQVSAAKAQSNELMDTYEQEAEVADAERYQDVKGELVDNIGQDVAAGIRSPEQAEQELGERLRRMDHARARQLIQRDPAAAVGRLEDQTFLEDLTPADRLDLQEKAQTELQERRNRRRQAEEREQREAEEALRAEQQAAAVELWDEFYRGELEMGELLEQRDELALDDFTQLGRAVSERRRRAEAEAEAQEAEAQDATQARLVSSLYGKLLDRSLTREDLQNVRGKIPTSELRSLRTGIRQQREDREQRQRTEAQAERDAQAADLFARASEGDLSVQALNRRRHELDLPDYKALLSAVQQQRASQDDEVVRLDLQARMYRREDVFRDILRAARDGALTPSTTSSLLAKNHELNRTLGTGDGPESAYDRNKDWMLTVLGEHNLVTKFDPAQARRIADAEREYDDYAESAPRAASDLRAKAEELAERYQFMSFQDTVAGLKLPYGQGGMRRGEVTLPRLQDAALALEQDFEAGRIDEDALEREKALLEQWMTVLERRPDPAPSEGRQR